jgi:RNA 2',3'-cyclic 3'-phosphodiesterase
VREQLVGWGRGVAAGSRELGASRAHLRLLAEDSLHLTLCFLGSRPVEEIDALVAVVSSGSEPACELTLGAPVWLPPRRPRALAVEVHDRDGELGDMHERVGGSLAAVSGWEPQRGRFRPHITVARIRGGGREGPRRKASVRTLAEQPQPLPATPRSSFLPEALVLYRSWLAPEGASYDPLASSRLQPAAR